jgi:FkbM family methyltransferase
MSIRSSFSGGVRRWIHNRGRELVNPDATYLFAWHRPRMFKALGINLVFDAGANIGQTALDLREEGYRGRIVSLEPLSGPFAELSKRAAADGNWSAKRCAVGEHTGEATMNVSGESVYSSLLPLDKAGFTGWIDPRSAYVAQEKVPMVSVNDLMKEFAGPNDRVCLKLDVQGVELATLRGGLDSLPRIQLVQMELTFPKMYEGQPKYYEVLQFLDQAGFEPVGIIPISRDGRTERYYQADILLAHAQQIDPNIPAGPL